MGCIVWYYIYDKHWPNPLSTPSFGQRVRNPKRTDTVIQVYSPLQSIFILATCALQSSTSVGTARSDASKIPDESESPSEPILNSSSCRDRSISITVDGSGRS